MITIQKSQLSVMNIQYRYFSLDKFLDDAVGNEVSNIELWGAMPFFNIEDMTYQEVKEVRHLEEFSRYHYKGYLSLEITDGRYYMDPTQSVQQSVNALYKVLK